MKHLARIPKVLICLALVLVLVLAAACSDSSSSATTAGQGSQTLSGSSAPATTPAAAGTAAGSNTSTAGSGAAAATATGATVPSDTASVPAVSVTADPTPPPPRDPAELKMSWETPAVFNGSNAYPQDKRTFRAADGSTLDFWVFQGGKPVMEFKPSSPISFGAPDDFTKINGVLAFRGSNWRTSPAWGNASVTRKKLEIVWTKDIGAVSSTKSYWPGTGWTGQPLLVNWPASTRQAMNIVPEMKAKNLVEVIYPVFDGHIYFLDLATGKATRPAINVGFPFKGTGLLDPRGYPLFYCGQGLNEVSGKYGEFNYHIFSLLDQKELYALYGRDSLAFRKWGAWDSSGLVDAKSDTLIECAENGMVYVTKLNTQYDEAAGKLSIAPQVTRYRYHSSATDELGIENSPAAWRSYLYFADNGGILQCLDLNTLKPVWVFNAQDDTDCTTTIEETAGGAVLYTANEIDKRSAASKKGENCNIRKLDALTGKLLWQYDVPCIYHYYLNAGALGTPLVGKDDISDLIIFNICLTSSATNGKLIALNKETGKPVWTRDLAAYSWSSPVAIKGTDGKTYAVFCDSAGIMHLFDPRTGKDLSTLSLGKNIESSPAVYQDMIVVGSYAQKIFGIRIS